MEKKELKELLSYLTKDQILKEYNISQSTLSRLLRKHNFTKRGYGAGKLNFSTAQEIRKMAGDYTQKQLAELFEVSQPTIHKILNNVVYKSGGPKVTGEADVKVGYNY
tara:strand:- start:55 stop:378 length:324 start_codon:yes stop_codon:yes gene_type:complete